MNSKSEPPVDASAAFTAMEAASRRAPDAAPVPLATRIVRGGASVALTSYGLNLFGFAANIILTRLLLPSDYGIVELGVFFFSLLDVQTKINVERAFAQRPTTTAESVGTFAALSLAAGVASFLLALAAAPILLAVGYSSAIVAVTVALGVIGVSNAVMGIAWVQLDKALLFSRVSLITALAFPISYIPAFLLAFNGGGFWSLVAQRGAYALLLLFGLWWSARRYLPMIWQTRWTFSRALARQFLRFGVVIGIATVAATLVYQFDNFLVGTFVSLAVLGFYSRAYGLADWPSFLVTSVLTRTAFYAYSQLQNDLPRLTKTFTMSLWIVTTLALPIALAIFISADDLVLLLWGERWQASALFVRLLVAYSILHPLLDDATSLFIAVGQPRRTTIVTLAQAAALVIAATPLTFLMGAVGTAIGVGIAFVVGLIVTYYFVRRTIPGLSLLESFGVPVVATAVVLVAYFLFAPVLVTWSIPLAARVILDSALAALFFFAVTLALRPRLTVERTAYMWRLFRNREDDLIRE